MLFYTDHGKGDVVILLHGYLETSEVWESFAARLSRSCRVIAVDLPGHGKSALNAGTGTMESMAAEIKELIDSLGLSKVFMTGHSLGGYITLAFAEQFPEMLSGYCLFHSHPLENTSENIEKREREIALVKAGKKDLMYPDNISRLFANENIERFSAELERSRKIASGIPGEAIVAVLNGMILRPSRVHVMESGKIPCLWILGAKDNYIDCRLVQAKVKLPVNAKLVILEKSGHIGFVEEEEKSLEVLTGFIEKCT